MITQRFGPSNPVAPNPLLPTVPTVHVHPGLPRVDYTIQPQDRSHFHNIRYFTQRDWMHAKEKQGDVAGGINKLGFLQQLNGDDLTRSERSTITEFAKKLWNEMYWHDVDPVSWATSLETAAEWFYSKLCQCFPLFAYQCYAYCTAITGI